MVAENTLLCDRRCVFGLGCYCKAIGSPMPQAPDTIRNVGGQMEGPESAENNKNQEMGHISLQAPQFA